MLKILLISSPKTVALKIRNFGVILHNLKEQIAHEKDQIY